MTTANEKLQQYLGEAHATETGLIRVLESQIAMTPRGSYRNGLEKHLGETREHAERLRARMRELGDGGGVLQAGIGIAESVAAQVLALSKTPLDLLRGHGGEEKVLKNAKDAAATEALEIATYTAIEQLAEAVGDDETARLAASIRADEQRMLDKVLREIPKLTAAVVRAEVRGDGSYDVAKTGAADATRAAASRSAQSARRTARKAPASRAAQSVRRTARKAPGATRAEGAARRAASREQDLPIARYGSLNADEIVGRLPQLTQVELAQVEVYERAHDNRTTVIERITSLRTSEPWPGYDEMTVDELRRALADADERRARAALVNGGHRGGGRIAAALPRKRERRERGRLTATTGVPGAYRRQRR